MSFADRLEKDARLCILKTLSEQSDHRLSDRMLVISLDSWGVRRAVDYVRTQLLMLRDIGAVTLPEETPAIFVAEITTAGLNHVRRRGQLSGVRFPDPGEFRETGD